MRFFQAKKDGVGGLGMAVILVSERMKIRTLNDKMINVHH
jgi:hypothetical protein